MQDHSAQILTIMPKVQFIISYLIFHARTAAQGCRIPKYRSFSEESATHDYNFALGKLSLERSDGFLIALELISHQSYLL